MQKVGSADVLRPVRLDPSILRQFVEYEVDLLDQRKFQEWFDLFDEDGLYWVPIDPEQKDGRDFVSLFYDDKATLQTRVSRLTHPLIHCQDPPSRCIRVVSNFAFEREGPDPLQYEVRSKFVMVEDRLGRERGIYAGRYFHRLRSTPEGIRIVLKRVDLTGSENSFPTLSQPF